MLMGVGHFKVGIVGVILVAEHDHIWVRFEIQVLLIAIRARILGNEFSQPISPKMHTSVRHS